MAEPCLQPVIRNYEPGDLAACRGLWVALTEWHREIYASPGIGGDDPGRQFDAHLEQVGPTNLWLALVDDTVVGLTGLIRGDEPELEPLVVLPAFRGRGIGRALAATVIDAARESGLRQLSVRPVARNTEAIRFFGAAGFGVIGHVELFMKLGSDGEQSWRSGERLADREFLV